MSAPDMTQDHGQAPTSFSPLRLFSWSVRRELWESRSIFVAPLAIAALVIFGFTLGALHPVHVTTSGTLDTLRQSQLRQIPFYVAAFAIMIVSLLASIFYCLGALHGERRDKSILFWKSLPVSDLTTVLSKASIALFVAPVTAFATILVTEIVLLSIGTLAALARAGSGTEVWANNPVLTQFWSLPYGLIVLSLWYAPVFGWLLLVSSWARRTPILWAFAPIIGLPLLEKLAFGTTYIGDLMTRRLHGGFNEAFASTPAAGALHVDFARPEPLSFLTAPGLWIGLAVAAAFLAGAVWLRRRAEPI